MQDAVRIEIDEVGQGPIWLFAEYRHKEQCKLVPGSRWDANRRQWRVPLSWAACKQLRGVFGDRLVVGPNLVLWAQAEVDRRVNPCLQLRHATDGPGDPGLFAFQRPGVQFLKTAEHALLADEMGTGKTVQVAVALRELAEAGEDPYPCLVVAPNSVKTSWRRELQKWVPGVDVQLISGGAVQRRKAIDAVTHVGVVNYESTWRNSRLAGYGSIRLTAAEKEPKELNDVAWRTVILDEAHRVKNPRAKQTRACWYLGHQSTVRFRWALTGTPLANAPDDLWALLHFLDPEEWPAKSAYVDRYCLQSWSPYGGLDVVGVRPEMKEEFYALLDPRMRRMPKELVLPFLPPKVRSVREAPMVPKQAKAYKQMSETMTAVLAEDADGRDVVAATQPIVKAMRLMQFSSAFAELNEEGKVRLSTPSNKVDALLEVLDELGPFESVVVFAQSRQLIELASFALAERRVSHGLIVGGMSDDQRDRSMLDFQEGRTRVILLTIQAGGEGITLTAARHAVFMQRSWSMLGNKQAEDRVHRIGSEQHDTIHLIDLIAPGTIEEEQVETLHAKFARLQEIVRDKETVRLAGDAAALARLEAEENAIVQGDLATEVLK